MHFVNRYSSVPVNNPENVAEHSWQVAMLSFLLGVDITDYPPFEDAERPDMYLLLARALIHDLTETMSGDIIRSYKHGSIDIREAMEHQDRQNAHRLARELGLPAVGHLCNHAKADDLEGTIISLADMLCVVSYCVAEHRLGNREVDYILRAMYQENLHRYHWHPYVGHYVDAVFPNRNYEDAYA